MRILTLNTHSLIEKNYDKKLKVFLDVIEKHRPSIIALQEVMQPKFNTELEFTDGLTICGKIPAKVGNHALNALLELKSRGLKYHCVWLGIKKAYEIFDEGLCFFTDKKIEGIDIIDVSKIDRYDNWKTRKALGIKIDNIWYYNVHLGWWDDKDSPQQEEIERINQKIDLSKEAWVMGDFNFPDHEINRGYDMMCEKWFDTYYLADERDDGITVEGKIDGWESRERKRIDYIFTNRKKKIEKSQVIFNGKNEEVISDHFGIMLN